MSEECKKIKVNKIRCKNCGDIIESKTVHDFVTCKCGNVSVDGGKEVTKSVKVTKKKFMESLGTEEIHTKLVDRFPEEIEVGIIYVNKSGNTVWIKGN